MDRIPLTTPVAPIPAPVDAVLEQGPAESQPWTSAKQIQALSTILAGSLAAGVLLWVALYNGYPTIFSDTGSYLLTGAFHIALAPYRAPGYSAFTRLTSFGANAWITIAAQAVLVIYVLYETCNHLIVGERKFIERCLLAAVCVLAALTSLPWLVSLLMPDVFAGILFLSAFLLAYAGELRRNQRILLASILMISVAAHTSLFPIAALLIATVAFLKFAVRDKHGFPPPAPALAWLLVPVMVAGFWTAAQNRRMGLGWTLSPSGNSFLLGRLFGAGLAQNFLRQNCPKRQFTSCRYLSNLPRNEEEFMFHHPLLLSLKGHPREIQTIVRGTLFAYSQSFLWSSGRQTLLQLAALRTGDEIRSYAADDWNNAAMQRVFPGELQAYRNARQFGGRLRPLADAASVVHTVTFWLSLAGCLLFAWTGRFARMNRFLGYAILFLLYNAAVCGALSGVYDRYQSRVAWLIPFCLVAYVCCLIQERKRGAACRGTTALGLT